MSHPRAIGMMVLTTLLWSTAGVVSRWLQMAQGVEVTFWRSAFTALSLAVALTALRGMALWRGLRHSSKAVWLSGVCWATMFTAFMLAVMLTRVANVLVTMAIGPLVTALFARLFLHHRLLARTWVAIAVAGAGIGWMFGHEVQAADPGGLLGMAVALAVPLAAAVNFTVLQHTSHGEAAGESQDMLPAVLIGALLSALVTLPLAWPLRASGHDLVLLAGLGAFQLALPCLMVVGLSRSLPAPEISLLGLLEVVFGVLWAWLGAGEAPGPTALTGGALVLGALVGNEALALFKARRRPTPA
jgi:drug/metabolite transporter (DMT)-like permease